MTGRYIHNTKELTNGTKRLVGTVDKERSLGILMSNAGYTTSYVGKYTHGYEDLSYIPPGWDNWLVFRGGFVPYYDGRVSRNGAPEALPPGEYSTDFIAKEALSLIPPRGGDPIFHVVSFGAPHMPDEPAPRHKDRLKTLNWAPPLPEMDLSDKSGWLIEDRRINGAPGENCDEITFHPADWKICDTYRRRLLSLLAVDEYIGALFERLKETDRLNNTFVIVVSDHGDDLSRRLNNSTGKLLAYDEGLRTPLFITGPDIQQNIIIDGVLSHVDLYPTFAEMAGVDVSERQDADGRSFYPLLIGGANRQDWREYVVAQVGDFKGWWRKPTPPGWTLIRSNEFKFIEYTGGDVELYDLRLDPHETQNIAASISDDKTSEFKELLKTLSSCAGDECKVADRIKIRDVY